MKTLLIALASLAVGILATWSVMRAPRLSADEQHALLTVVSLKAVHSKADGSYSRMDLGLAEEAQKLPDSAFAQKLKALAMSARFVTDEAAARELVAKCDGIIAVYSHMASN